MAADPANKQRFQIGEADVIKPSSANGLCSAFASSHGARIYAAAETLAQVLKQCGNDLSRESVMKQAAALKDHQGSVLLPGIKISTGPWNFRPIKHLRLVQFDGRTWQPIGEVLETAFSNADR